MSVTVAHLVRWLSSSYVKLERCEGPAKRFEFYSVRKSRVRHPGEHPLQNVALTFQNLNPNRVEVCEIRKFSKSKLSNSLTECCIGLIQLNSS